MVSLIKFNRNLVAKIGERRRAHTHTHTEAYMVHIHYMYIKNMNANNRKAKDIKTLQIKLENKKY